MSDAQRDYWTECVEISFEEAGIQATAEQIEVVAGGIEGCHENYGMAFYQPPAGEYEESKSVRLKRELAIERDKIICNECKGRGRIIENFGFRSSDSECMNCRGEGRHTP